MHVVQEFLRHMCGKQPIIEGQQLLQFHTHLIGKWPIKIRRYTSIGTFFFVKRGF
jgi:hypothetical protein